MAVREREVYRLKRNLRVNIKRGDGTADTLYIHNSHQIRIEKFLENLKFVEITIFNNVADMLGNYIAFMGDLNYFVRKKEMILSGNVLTTEEVQEEDHEGMIYNEYTGKWGWL